MELNFSTMRTLKNSFVAITTVSLIALSGASFATVPTSGQLVVINSLGIGASKSSVLVTVHDGSGPCSTTSTLVYNGVIVVQWNTTNTHSTTTCTGISSVDVSALKTSANVVQYDSTANATPPITATTPTTFAAPTTPITNLVLIVTGGTSPAMTQSATSWGSVLGVAPIYSVSDGSLTTTGIMGGVGTEGMNASKLMLKHGVMPAGQAPYTVQ